MDDLSQELALLQEKKRRRELRSSLHAWAKQATGYEPASHHTFLLDRLEDVTYGRLGNLIVLMPPGSAKSKYISNAFPPWWLGKNPTGAILAVSHSKNLIRSFSRNCRNLVDLYHKDLGYGLKPDTQAADEWETSLGGRYFCAGVGAGISGHRADLGFIDDYLGSEEDANSDIIREAQWQWFINDFAYRVKPGCPMIIVANRRHEDDLVGRILEEEPENWTVIRLPFDAEEGDPLGRAVGEPLWPEWFLKNDKAKKQVERARRHPRSWAGLWQQKPALEAGNFFEKSWIREYQATNLPKDLRYYCASDHAVKTKQDNDKTCLLVAGVDVQNRIWIVDWFWDRVDTGIVVAKMIAFARQYKPLRWWAGSDHITGSIGPFLSQKMKDSGVYFPLEEVTARGDKQARAQAIAGRMSEKMVLFPSDLPGWVDAKHEMLMFPGGKHDDFVDALAELGRGLAKMVPASLTVNMTGNSLPEWQKPITMQWVKDSHKRREREERRVLEWQ